MGKLFGTDGIRGVPWNYPFTYEFIRKIGYAASVVLAAQKRCAGHTPTVLIGMDSRASGRRIKKALVEGLGANKFRVLDLGVISTPAVSYLVQRENADFGIVISASHNPPEFNGIKFFAADGLKLPDAVEARIEALLLGGKELKFKPALHALHKADYSGDYVDFIKGTLPEGFSLKGVKLVLDCANGAAYRIAPRIFRDLGADLKVIGDRPDGKNINVGCGALYTERMQKAVVKYGAFCGISLDGDADRCMLSDEKGRLMDGDDLIGIAAPWLRGKGRLTGNKAVLTVMSNLGLVKYLKDSGIGSVQVPVGDKNVTEALEKGNFKIGGEASGHIIMREFAPTGDGILTAVQMLAILLDTGRPASWFRARWKRFPQLVVPVKVSAKPPLDKVRGFSAKVGELEGRLGDAGRIFVRYSGTEPLLRVLVEGESKSVIKGIAGEIVEHYRKHSGAAAA